MRIYGMILCAVFFTGFMSFGAVAQPDLSSPKEALKSFIRLKCVGATQREYDKVVSKENAAIVSGLDDAIMVKRDLDERMPAEDKYEKLTIVSKQSTGERAIFLLKVRYKDSWLKQEMAEIKAMGDKDDVPVGQKSGGEFISDATPGEASDSPYQIKGEGFVSFLFVKQDGMWRFHKSYASTQPSNFVPLLKENSLMRGIAMTTTPRVSSIPSLPTTASDQPLVGRISGKEWRGLFVYQDVCASKEAHYGVEVVEKEESDEYKRMVVPKICVQFPKKPGEYPLTSKNEVIFFTPPGKSRTATKGVLTVAKIGATYKVELIARFDQDNDIHGGFAFTPPKGE